MSCNSLLPFLHLPNPQVTADAGLAIAAAQIAYRLQVVIADTYLFIGPVVAGSVAVTADALYNPLPIETLREFADSGVRTLVVKAGCVGALN